MSIKGKKISITTIIVLITSITSITEKDLCKEANTFNENHKNEMNNNSIQDIWNYIADNKTLEQGIQNGHSCNIQW